MAKINKIIANGTEYESWITLGELELAMEKAITEVSSLEISAMINRIINT